MSVLGAFTQGKTDLMCINCPPWSTTQAWGSISVSQCACLGSGLMSTDNTCKIPSPYTTMPSACPALSACASATYDDFPFPLQMTCTLSIADTPLGVCRCQPGEFIAQIYPKECLPCPGHLYSPVGESCIRCPPFGEPSLDGAACRCAAGTVDVDLSESTIECVCGPGKGFDTQYGCYPCPENKYNSASLTLGMTPWTQSKQCETCPLGTWSTQGSSQCTPCPAGTYRDNSVDQCTQCPAGQFATDTVSRESCTDCQIQCAGRRQTPCPTDTTKFVCVDCPPARANSEPNGLDNCATACVQGFYDKDDECTQCSRFNATACPAGNILIPCGTYTDSACAPCFNASMPQYYARYIEPSGLDASMSCAWECIEGYIAQSTAWIGDVTEIWACVKQKTWTLMDIFTI